MLNRAVQKFYRTSLEKKTLRIASNLIFVVLLLGSFCGFSIFVAGFSLLLATLLIIVSPSSTLQAIEIKKKCLQWVTFPRAILIHRHDARRFRGPVHGFQKWRYSTLDRCGTGDEKHGSEASEAKQQRSLQRGGNCYCF